MSLVMCELKSRLKSNGSTTTDEHFYASSVRDLLTANTSTEYDIQLENGRQKWSPPFITYFDAHLASSVLCSAEFATQQVYLMSSCTPTFKPYFAMLQYPEFIQWHFTYALSPYLSVYHMYNMAAQRELSLCDVLCFLSNKFVKLPVKQLKSTLSDFYAVEALTEAKVPVHLLGDIEKAEPSVQIPHRPRRRDGDSRAAREYDIVIVILF